MAHYRLSKRADDDLSNLYEYGILNFGLERAQSYFLGLHDRFQILAASPAFGRQASELSLNLRRSEYQSHVIFYM